MIFYVNYCCVHFLLFVFISRLFSKFGLLFFLLHHLSDFMGKQQCGFGTGPSQRGLKHRRQLEAVNFGFRKEKNCTIRIAKTKVTAKLI